MAEGLDARFPFHHPNESSSSPPKTDGRFISLSQEWRVIPRGDSINGTTR